MRTAPNSTLKIAHRAQLNIKQLQRYNLAQAMSRVKGKFNIKKQINSTFLEYRGEVIERLRHYNITE